MSKVAIVTDSTAYLPSELVKQYQITVLPLSIIWEGKSYRDGIDIQPEEFYQRLQKAGSMPTTSQITTPAMQSAFSALLEQGYDVLGIFLSSKFSGTMQSAEQARQMIPGVADKIVVMDSQFTIMAMGWSVLAAARAASAGEKLASCREIAERTRDHSGVYFVVETLEFLRRGGRIGGAQALLGTVLNIKPLLKMRDGQIEAVEKIRTKTAALNRMLELTVEQVGSKTPARLATAHAKAEAEASALLADVCAQLNPVESYCRPLTPVVGAHVGPGTVALSYMAGSE